MRLAACSVLCTLILVTATPGQTWIVTEDGDHLVISARRGGGDLYELVRLLEPHLGDTGFVITPEAFAGVWSTVDWADVAGATIAVARMNESTATVPDVLTWNGKRVKSSPVRVRAMDVLVTRLELP